MKGPEMLSEKIFKALMIMAMLIPVALIAFMAARPEATAPLHGPSWCTYCNGLGEIDVETLRTVDEKDCSIVDHNPCPVCKGTGVGRNLVADRYRQKIDLRSLGVDYHLQREIHLATWKDGSVAFTTTYSR